MSQIDLEKLVVFDLETTGLESDCRIVQIAMIRGEKIFQSLVNPGIPIPPESTEIHRITDEDVASAPKFEKLADEVLEFLRDAMVSGFNIRRFDIPVLRRELAQVGKKLPPLPILDLFELNQKMNPRSLAWFYNHYTGQPMDSAEAHDAVYDCICTLKGFMGMFEKHPDMPQNLEALSILAEPDRLPIAGSEWLVWTVNQCEPSFTRGKYRGWALSEVGRKEPSYLHWLLSIDADSSTKNIIHLFKKQSKAYVEHLREEHPLRWEPQYMVFRAAMERKAEHRYPELLEMSKRSSNPSLAFLAAAWATQSNRPESRRLAETYLAMDDPYVNADRRKRFLQKSHDLG